MQRPCNRTKYFELLTTKPLANAEWEDLGLRIREKRKRRQQEEKRAKEEELHAKEEDRAKFHRAAAKRCAQQ